MKSFFVLFLLFVLLSPVKAQYDFDEIERVRMVEAKVKTQTEWTYDYVNGKPSSTGYKSSVTKFDTRGNITEIANYNANGKLISTIIYQYDAYNNRVNFERYDEKRVLKYSQKIVYNDNGKKIREYGKNGMEQYNNTFTYDGNGKLTEINYTANNMLVEKRQFVYSGNKTEISVFNASNILSFRQENTYNENGFLLSELRKGVQGNVIHSLNMQYSNLGELLQEIKKRADDKLDYHKTYHYDNNNRPIKEETINLDGTKFISREYQYNNSGDLILESWRKNERATEFSTKKFTYDSKRIYTEVDSYFATYKLNSLYKYVYEYY